MICFLGQVTFLWFYWSSNIVLEKNCQMPQLFIGFCLDACCIMVLLYLIPCGLQKISFSCNLYVNRILFVVTVACIYPSWYGICCFYDLVDFFHGMGISLMASTGTLYVGACMLCYGFIVPWYISPYQKYHSHVYVCMYIYLVNMFFVISMTEWISFMASTGTLFVGAYIAREIWLFWGNQGIGEGQ